MCRVFKRNSRSVLCFTMYCNVAGADVPAGIAPWDCLCAGTWGVSWALVCGGGHCQICSGRL